MGSPTFSPCPVSRRLIRSAAAAATHVDLLYQEGGGVWYEGWPGAQIVQTQPPYASWTNEYRDLETHTNCPKPAQASVSASSAMTADAPSALRKVALDLAAHNGDARPRAVTYVATHRQAAIAATTHGQDAVPSDQPVYLIRVDGNFRGWQAKTPAGHPRPTGNVLTAAVDPATGRVVDWSIQHTGTDIAQLGPTTRLS
jgi:hypothetical protein